MTTTHFEHWPPNQSHHLSIPQTSLVYNLEVSAQRFPDKAATIYYDAVLTWREMQCQVEALAGYLQQHCGIKRGDRVLLYLQNCPQFFIGYYAILRADAFVVPVNPMLKADELAHLQADSQASVARARPAAQCCATAAQRGFASRRGNGLRRLFARQRRWTAPPRVCHITL